MYMEIYNLLFFCSIISDTQVFFVSLVDHIFTLFVFWYHIGYLYSFHDRILSYVPYYNEVLASLTTVNFIWLTSTTRYIYI